MWVKAIKKKTLFLHVIAKFVVNTLQTMTFTNDTLGSY